MGIHPVCEIFCPPKDAQHNFCITLYRYQRVRDAQLLGETTREKWHGAKAGDSGKSFELPMPEWLMAHDAEAHAYAAYDDIAQSIVQDGYRQPSLDGEQLSEHVKETT